MRCADVIQASTRFCTSFLRVSLGRFEELFRRSTEKGAGPKSEPFGALLKA